MQAGAGAGAGGAGAGAGGAAAAAAAAAKTAGLAYICGGCGTMNSITPRDTIRCRACGYRIFYKVRTDRLTQFEAR